MHAWFHSATFITSFLLGLCQLCFYVDLFDVLQEQSFQNPTRPISFFTSPVTYTRRYRDT